MDFQDALKIVMLLAILSSSATAVNAHVGEKYVANYAKNPVTVDGKWTTADEWTDANERVLVPSKGATGKAMFRAKHDSNYVYVLFEFLTDTKIDERLGFTSFTDYDFAAFYFDPNHKASSKPTEEQCAFSTYWITKNDLGNRLACGSSRIAEWETVAERPDTFQAASSDSYDYSPHRLAHVTYELKIPKKYERGRAVIYDFSEKNKIGFAAWVNDNAMQFSMNWPEGRSRLDPSTWSDFELATKPMAEEPKPTPPAKPPETKPTTPEPAKPQEKKAEAPSAYQTGDSLTQFAPYIAVAVAAVLILAIVLKRKKAK